MIRTGRSRDRHEHEYTRDVHTGEKEPENSRCDPGRRISPNDAIQQPSYFALLCVGSAEDASGPRILRIILEVLSEHDHYIHILAEVVLPRHSIPARSRNAILDQFPTCMVLKGSGRPREKASDVSQDLLDKKPNILRLKRFKLRLSNYKHRQAS